MKRMTKIMGLCLGLCSGLCGCDTLTLTGPSLLVSDIAANKALEQKILSALHDEDKLLLFLSRGRSGGMPYGCGDPNDPNDLRHAELKKEDAVKARAIEAAVALIADYKKALDDLSTNETNTESGLNELSSDLSSVASFTGNPEYASAASVAGKLAVAVAQAANRLEAQAALARFVDKGLNDAVELLGKNTTALQGPTLAAFRRWDACARETLAYIRDVPLGKVAIKTPRRVYPSYVAQSTGVELKNAYTDYLRQRAEFIGEVPKFADDINLIKAQNAALASGKISPSDIKDFIGLLGQAHETAQNLNKTVTD